MKRYLTGAATLFVILAGTGGAGAQSVPASCDLRAYEDARAGLRRELLRYSACINGGSPSESCSTAFYRVRVAQKAFEAAVQENRVSCN